MAGTSENVPGDPVEDMTHPNPVTEERFQIVIWLYRIGKQHKIGILLLPDHLKGLFEPLMPSKYTRTDGDIKEAVEMWCSDPEAHTKAETRYGHISNWDVNQVTNLGNFLQGNTALSTANYNLLLHHWHADDPIDSLAFHGGDATTDSSTGGVDGTAARAALVLATGSGGDGWTITDGD